MQQLGLLAAALILLAPSAYAAPPRLLAFQREADIWVADADGAHPRKIVQGDGPEISPDGARIAFNTAGEKRRIAVVEVATKKVKVFQDEIPSDNCFGATWSPDGAQILFKIWTENNWHLGLIHPDGSGFRYLKKSMGATDSLWSLCWAADGASIYGQDLDRIYQFSMEGKELARWEIRKLFPEGSFSSASRLAMAPDGKRILLEVDMDEEEAVQPEWEGPPPSLWLWEMASGKTTRLTPKGMLALEGSWLDDARILYVNQTAKDKQPVLSEMTLAKKDRKAVLKNATSPSVGGR